MNCQYMGLSLQTVKPLKCPCFIGTNEDLWGCRNGKPLLFLQRLKSPYDSLVVVVVVNVVALLLILLPLLSFSKKFDKKLFWHNQDSSIHYINFQRRICEEMEI